MIKSPCKKIIFFCFILINLINAQSEEYSVKRLSLTDGLSQSSIYSIIQDNQGFMWFTTEDGLNRYDGYEFTVYKNNSIDKNSLSENSIYSIAEGASGVLWISTWSTGINKFDVKNNIFTRYISNTADSTSLSNDFIYDVSVDNEGFIWIVTDDGLNRLDTATNTFRHFHHDPADNKSLLDDNISKLAVDNEGNIWIVCGSGLSRYNPHTETFTNYRRGSDNDSLPDYDIRSIAVCKVNPHTLWLGTTSGGIERMNTKTGTVEQFGYGYIPGIPKDIISAIDTDYKGNIWIGTNSNGVIVLNPDNKKLKKLTKSYSDPNTISQNTIYSLYVSKSGLVWAGTGSAGINIINEKIKNFKWYRENDDPNRILSANVLAGLMEDSQHNLWICGWNSGITVINLETNKTRIIKKNTVGNNGLNSNSVMTTFELADGRIVISTTDGGLNIYNPQTRKFDYIRHIPGNSNSLAENYVMTGLQDKDGLVWLGYNSQGIDKWDLTTNTFTHYLHIDDDNSIVGNQIYTMYEDIQGNLWISAQRAGVSVLDKKTNQFTQFIHDENDPQSIGSNDVMVFFQASDKTMWVGTFGAGLNKYNPENNTFKSYREEDGLPNNVVYGILEDNDGFLWLSTNKGISRFDPGTEQFRNYDVSDGLQSNEFNSSYCKTTEGEMFFGGINGLNSFFPEDIKDNTFVPPVYITNLQILNKNIVANKEFNGRKVLSHSISYTDQIELTYDDYLVNLEFASLNYINSHKNKYAYKLEGFDKDWNLSDNIRFATYRNLPPGEYVFRVKGSNNDNVWNNRGASLKVLVIPAFWQTLWFRSLLFVVLVFALVSYYKSRTGSIKKQNIKLEKAVKDKTREMKVLMEKMIRQEKLATIGKISGSIAHELRNPLGAVRQSVYYLRTKFSKVSDKMNKHLDLIDSELSIADKVIDDLLEMTRLKKLNKEYTDLVILINQSLQRSNINGNIDVKINIHPQDQFAWVDQLQLGQVFVNLITNSAQAMDGQGILTFIAFQTTDNKYLQIDIMDNGPGISHENIDKIFEPLYTSKAKGTGLGLSICKQIIEKHGGEIRINSEINKGTNVSILLPVNDV